MQQQDDSHNSTQTHIEPGVPTRKMYESPRLVEWGSILDLTLGLGGGFEDIPKGAVGGTTGT